MQIWTVTRFLNGNVYKIHTYKSQKVFDKWRVDHKNCDLGFNKITGNKVFSGEARDSNHNLIDRW